jgi:Cu(I)/Ag(I) efflux system membrane fusion protein
MFAQVELPAADRGPVLTVPTSAVIHTGTRHVVLVQLAEGRFEPREIKPGAESDNYVEVRGGVREGEPVVVAANFLIDAESNLKAALGGLNQPEHGAAASGTKSVSHRAEGTLDAIDSGAGSVTLSHGPVASLKWPAMTMDFNLANPSLVAKLKPGTAVAFEFVERQPGEWVITKVEAKKPAGHAGH